MLRLHQQHSNDPLWRDDPSTTDDGSSTDVPGDPSAGSPTSFATTPSVTQVLYLTEPGNSSAIAATDIHQGGLGDCFLLSSIGEIALFHPSMITGMIHATSVAATETVSLYKLSYARFGGFIASPTRVTVHNSAFSPVGVDSTRSISQDILGNQQETWPQVIEEAAANLNGGYNSIANGGSPVIAMEELTGQAAAAYAPASLSWNTLLSDQKAGDLLVFDTANAKSLPYGLVGDHAYMFASANSANQTVQLLNPWGFDNPGAIPFARLAQAGVVEIDIGRA